MSTPHGWHRAWPVADGGPQPHEPMRTGYEVLEKRDGGQHLLVCAGSEG